MKIAVAREGTFYLLSVLVVLLMLSTVNATIYVSNDHDWRLPYLLGYYSTKMGNYFFALTTKDDSIAYTYILEQMVKKVSPGEDIVIYEGPDPVIPNYDSVLRSKGIDVRVVRYNDIFSLMFDLPKDLGFSPKGALLVPDGVGAWLLSSAPLAYKEDLAIYLINNRVIDRLSRLPYDDIVIVGYNGKRLISAYPSAKRIATGNKARDSVEIAKLVGTGGEVYVMSGLYLYTPAYPDKTVYFTGNGGRVPILITRLDRLDDPVRDFILGDNNVKVVGFVGPELAPVWLDVKRKYSDTGKKFIILMSVKYPNVPGKDPNRDYYPPGMLLPSGEVAVRVESARILPDRVFINMRNLGQGSGYFLINEVDLNCEGYPYRLGPTPPTYIGGGEIVSVIVESNDTIPVNRQCTITISGFYGSDKDRMDIPFSFSSVLKSEAVEKGNFDINVIGAKYWPSLERIAVTIRNPSDEQVYAQVKADVSVDGIVRPIRSRVVRVSPHSERVVYLKVYLTEADVLDNENMSVDVFYGRDPSLLYNLKKFSLHLEKATLTDEVIRFIRENTLLVGVTVLILIVIALILRRR